MDAGIKTADNYPIQYDDVLFIVDNNFIVRECKLTSINIPTDEKHIRFYLQEMSSFLKNQGRSLWRSKDAAHLEAERLRKEDYEKASELDKMLCDIDVCKMPNADMELVYEWEASENIYYFIYGVKGMEHTYQVFQGNYKCVRTHRGEISKKDLAEYLNALSKHEATLIELNASIENLNKRLQEKFS